MQHMFRTPEVEVYMGLIWLLWQKKWISHLFVKKSKNKFFLVSKGCFGCKMMRGIQKSWSQCSTMLPSSLPSFLPSWSSSSFSFVSLLLLSSLPFLSSSFYIFYVDERSSMVFLVLVECICQLYSALVYHCIMYMHWRRPSRSFVKSI